MKKSLLALVSTLAVLSACVLPNNTTINKQNNLENKPSLDDKLKSEFMERFKNKKFENIDRIDISINTLLNDNKEDTNNVFQVLSNTGIVRKKTFLVGEHATNDSHIRDKDINIFNPNDPQSLILSVV